MTGNLCTVHSSPRTLSAGKNNSRYFITISFHYESFWQTLTNYLYQLILHIMLIARSQRWKPIHLLLSWLNISVLYGSCPLVRSKVWIFAFNTDPVWYKSESAFYTDPLKSKVLVWYKSEHQHLIQNRSSQKSEYPRLIQNRSGISLNISV